MQITFKNINMDCAMCAQAIDNSFKDQAIDIAINIAQKKAVLKDNDKGLFVSELLLVFKQAGYVAQFDKSATPKTIQITGGNPESKLRMLAKEGFIVDVQNDTYYIYTKTSEIKQVTERLEEMKLIESHQHEDGHKHDHEEHDHEHGDMHSMVDHQHSHNKSLITLRLWMSIIIFTVSELPMLQFLGIETPLFDFLHHPYTQAALSTLLLLVVGMEFFIGAYKGIKNRILNMDVLVTFGALTAYFFSWYQVFQYGIHNDEIHFYFEAASAIIALIYIGHYLEHRASDKVNQTLDELMKIGAKTATVITETGEKQEVAVENVAINQLVYVAPNVKIPMDGIVETGESYVDESMISGEPVPVFKTKGTDVIGGTLNTNAELIVQVRKTSDDGVLAEIIQSVEKAQMDKPDIQLLADRISSIFVPTILLIAIITFCSWYFIVRPGDFISAFEPAISVVVISCPCALGLATPLSVLVGSSRAAKLGILYKSGKVFEKIKKIEAICFDKTGTLTYGRPTVVATYGEYDEKIAHIIYNMERESMHPFAYALNTYLKERFTVDEDDTISTEEIAGHGVTATIAEKQYSIGSFRWLQTLGVTMEEEERAFADSHLALGHSVLGMTDGTKLILFVMADEIKTNAVATIKDLQAQGIEVSMITGDAEKTAQAVAKELGITTVYAGVLPHEKAQYIEKIQATGKQVAFVGDGINDAPALATADLGIALGSGTQIALSAADVTLVNSDLSGISTALTISKMTLRNIHQNFGWAFSYNLVAIPVAAMGLLSPVLAAGFMAFSDIVVVGNAARLRIQRIKK